jgi:hypothetical protein
MLRRGCIVVRSRRIDATVCDITSHPLGLLGGGMTATIVFYEGLMMTNMICIGILMIVNRWSQRAGSRGLG